MNRPRGRPVKAPTKTKTFRIDEEVLKKAERIFGKGLNKKINEWLKRLINRQMNIEMKNAKILLLLVLFFVSYTEKSQDCKSYSVTYQSSTGPAKLSIVYNKFYGKYAVRRSDGSSEYSFLMKDSFGDYGVFGEGWEDTYCATCVDRTKSLFKNPCDAKQFIITYIRKLKQDKWE